MDDNRLLVLMCDDWLLHVKLYIHILIVVMV